MMQLTRRSVQSLIRAALQEDAASHDITSCAIIPAGSRIRTRIVAKAPGVLAGGPVAVWTFRAVDPSLRCTVKRREAAPLAKGDTILTIDGRTRSIFAAERTALNFLGHLSGIATLTHAFVQRVKPYPVKILDTRKTLPGLRSLEKYAVRVGGGHSHRSDLREAILIKTNHLKVLRGMRSAECGMFIQDAIAMARRRNPKRFVEIEVTNLTELEAALQATPDAILLDNWDLQDIRGAVVMRNAARRTPHSALLLEVSGGVTLANVRAIAKTGADRISIGRLTHSAPALDCSLEVV